MPSNAVASIDLIANSSVLARGLSAATSLVQNFARATQATMQALHLSPKIPKDGGGFSVAKQALGTAAGLAASRGIDLLIAQGKQIFDFNDQLVRFGIAARISGTQLDWVGHTARRVAGDTGIAATEVLRGARAYVDMAGAAAFTADKMTLLAKVAQASQSDIGELAQVMFQLQRNMKVKDADLEDTFGGIVNMSKDGAVHFAQMAAEINELAPQAARFGMVGRQGVNELTALMQVARTGFGSVSEMGTGVTRVFTGLTMHADRFAQYGVRIFDVAKDGTKHWRHFSDIFNDIRKNNVLSKDPFLLRKAFGRSEADRTIRLWMESVDVLKELERAGERNGVVQQDLATYSESAAGRMQIAMERLKNAVADAFTPERIQAFVAAVEDLSEKLTPVLDVVGAVGDVFGGIYNIGKKIRGWMGNNGIPQIDLGYQNVRDYASRQGIDLSTHSAEVANFAKAQQGLLKEQQEARDFALQMSAMMPNDRSTPQANRLAIRTKLFSTSGTDVNQLAESYIAHSGLSDEQQRELGKQILTEQAKRLFAGEAGGKLKESIGTIAGGAGLAAGNLWGMITGNGRGYENGLLSGSSQVDIAVALTKLADAINKKTPTVLLDGNYVGKGVQDATDARRH